MTPLALQRLKGRHARVKTRFQLEVKKTQPLRRAYDRQVRRLDRAGVALHRAWRALEEAKNG